jgi:hypothetical protein
LLNSNLANGILVDNGATGTLVVRNRAIGNGDDGIDVDAPATTLTHNIANHNHDLGIEAVPGVIDGGGNTPRPTVTLCSARILTVNSGQVASGGLPGTIFACRQREGVRRSFWPPCHRRATSNGQSRYPADNHGHSGAAHELGRLRSASLNASREYA